MQVVVRSVEKVESPKQPPCFFLPFVFFLSRLVRLVLFNSVYAVCAVVRVESCRLHYYTGCVCSVAGLVGRPGMSDVRRRCGVYGNVGGEGALSNYNRRAQEDSLEVESKAP